MNTCVDVLMITYNRPEYTRLALARLLETCDDEMRVWLWHNGEHAETLEVVKSLAAHPRVHEFHHSRENKLLREPTNWFWTHAKGDLLGKVDDDCLAPADWGKVFRKVHEDVPRLGAVGCWIFLEKDFVPELGGPKIQELPGGHRLLRNHWLGGSGYLLKRRCVEEQGLLRERQSFPNYCLHLAKRGWINGYYYPFLYMDHMDDPRSLYTRMKDEQAFQANPSLSSRRFGTSSLAELQRRAVRAAIDVQAASLDIRQYFGWRAQVRRVKNRLSRNGRIARFDA